MWASRTSAAERIISPCPSLPMRRPWPIRAGANPGPPFMARLDLAHLLAERQRAYPLALSGVDRIEERRGDRRHARFAHSARRHVEAVRHDMDMRLTGRVADAQHLVVVEVVLLDLAVLERDFGHHGQPQTHDHGALHL